MADFSRIINRNDAGPLIPEDVYPEIIKAVSEASVALRLMRRLRNMRRGEARAPVLNSFPVAYFVNGDTGFKRTTEMDWRNVFINAEEIAAIVPVPINVLEDVDYDLWGECRPEIVASIAELIDNAIFFGVGAPAAWPNNITAAAVAAGNNVALGAGADAYQDILGVGGVVGLLEATGYQHNGHVASTGLKAILRDTRDLVGQPLMTSRMQDSTEYRLDGSPMYFPKFFGFQAAQTAIHMITGAFDEFVYAIRKDLDFMLADQAVISDPAGNIRYNLFQQDMVALRCTFRMGWACPNPINRLARGAANQYPAAVLTV